MVTCQSANQLKTPAKVSWAFKIVSQFGSLGYTIMGKTADLTVVQKTIIDTLTRRVSNKYSLPKKLAVHRVLYPSMLTESWVEGNVWKKRCTANRENAALWGLSSKINSRIWVNFTRNGLRLGSRHREPTTHLIGSRNLATVVIRGVLPGLRRRRTGLLPSGPKSSFQMRASFVFHLETKVLESGGRVEKLIAQVAWSPVLSQSVIIWGAMSFAGVGPLCFLKTNVTAPIYQDILEALHASFCWPAF